MAKFIAVTEDTKEPEVPKVKFVTSLDGGDFNLYANGEFIGYFSGEDGKLHLSGIYEDPTNTQAFDLDKNQYIRVVRD